MTTVTLTIPDKTKAELQAFPWVNWSPVAITAFRMKSIFEKYMKKKEISKEDWEFCELIDWHPVDELPLKEEYIKKLEEARKAPSISYNSVDEFFEAIK